ncbi:MAG TPA: class I SAM-dependent methyltransferase, partial [Nitrososphaera sp.]|nr:class I SAM-dependent methyltransferase [Nitrososphaera sp.]
MAGFKDLFSKQSKEYAASRPTYPKTLFEFLAGLVEHRGLAWDCATGNGQAARALAEYFDCVVASDASKEQIENAQAGNSSKVRFRVFSAEKPDLADASVDLVTVAQALHWFCLDDFYRETRRVAKKDAVIAAWTYGLHSINPEIDRVTQAFYEDIVGPYWPPEVRHVKNRYKDIPFPFPPLEAPDFKIELEWELKNVVGYLYSWSSTQKYIEENKSDPVEKVYLDLQAAWGGGKNEEEGTKK